MEMSIKELVKKAEKIHYFGLGFIQVKLNDYERYHFYWNELPVTAGDEEIHNHRYNFTSYIIAGSFEQSIWEVKEGVTHQLTTETCDPKTKSGIDAKLISIEPICDLFYEQDQSYYIDHHTFHTVMVRDMAITYLKRSDYKKEFAEVVSPVNVEKSCPFSVKMTKKECIEHIETICATLGVNEITYGFL